MGVGGGLLLRGEGRSTAVPPVERRSGSGGPGADGGLRRPREPRRFGSPGGISKH